MTKWSENTQAYYIKWRDTLHNNICGQSDCVGNCKIGAVSLAGGRLDNIAKGMPDLHPIVEDKIWELAFKIHERHGDCSGLIAPTWALDGPKCDCFEKAMAQLCIFNPPDTPRVIITEEDRWYETRIE